MEPNRILIVFAKAPRLGHVKTRLAADLGDEAALSIYRQMAEGVWTQVRRAQSQGAFSLWLCFDPPEMETEVRNWLEGADRYLPQVPGNLGRRLAAALDAAFSAGHQEVAVIGTDAPATTPERILDAFSRLAPGRMVLGPSLDGGFYLMALSDSLSDLGGLLEEIPWSSSDTLAALMGGVRGLGLDLHLLPQARDIDTLTDLKAHGLSPEGANPPLAWFPSAKGCP